jgi:hypothetical protein
MSAMPLATIARNICGSVTSIIASWTLLYGSVTSICASGTPQLKQIERERGRNSSHDLVSALADALANMTVQRDDLRRDQAGTRKPVQLSHRTGRSVSGLMTVHNAKSL